MRVRYVDSVCWGFTVRIVRGFVRVRILGLGEFWGRFIEEEIGFVGGRFLSVLGVEIIICVLLFFCFLFFA